MPYLGESVSFMEDVDQAEDENGSHVDREGDQEHEEVAVVATADTVVYPGAVMVENLEEKEKIEMDYLWLKSWLEQTKWILVGAMLNSQWAKDVSPLHVMG